MKKKVQNLWNHERENYSIKYIVSKEKNFQINSLSSHLKNLEKKEKGKSTASKRKETIKIRVGIDDIKYYKATKIIMKAKSNFFKKKLKFTNF